MSENNGVSEWYRKHRPRLFKHVVGQGEAAASLQKMLKEGVPHALLLAGPSGTGKTTLARIMKAKMGCDDADFADLNAASARGIDTVREIEACCRMRPMAGACRIWLIDECHKLTSDAQTALLKVLEDPPGHAYFFLATTDPGKLLKTILTRCTEVKVRPLDADGIRETLARVAAAEGVTVPESVIDAIAQAADGSARKAVNLLQQAAGLEEKQALQIVLSQDVKEASESLAKVLFDFKATRKDKWDRVRAILKQDGLDPEDVRRGVLGYARSVLLNSPTGRRADFAYDVIFLFEDSFYNSGAAGLAKCCYVILGK